MTDYSKWTDTEVNRAIAKAKGILYGYIPGIGCTEKIYYKIDDGNIVIMPTINFTHDWRLAGELLEEMAKGNQNDHICSLEYRQSGNWLVVANLTHCFAPTPQRAICEAWLAWEEI